MTVPSAGGDIWNALAVNPDGATVIGSTALAPTAGKKQAVTAATPKATAAIPNAIRSD